MGGWGKGGGGGEGGLETVGRRGGTPGVAVKEMAGCPGAGAGGVKGLRGPALHIARSGFLGGWEPDAMLGDNCFLLKL